MSDDHHCESALSDADLDRLQDLLFERASDEQGAMPLDMAHGFLSAVISGPRLVLPNEWLPRVLGEGDTNDDDALWMVQSVMGLYQDTLHALEHGHYGPIVLYRPDGDDPLPLPYGWCHGYVQGMYMHGEAAVEEAGTDQKAAGLLSPIAAFLMYEEEQMMNPPDPKTHREAADELAGSAVGLFHWWSPRREAPPKPS
jgi:uncharacterized protein